MLRSVILYSIYVVAALVLTAEGAPKLDASKERSSPCPNLFRYDSVTEGGWTGNLLLQSEDDLYGIWIRLIFDNTVKKISVDGDYEVTSPSDKNEVLIKNRDILLKAGSERNLRITVEYDGSKIPNLAGYRLNAKVLCPEANAKRTDFFQGDVNSRDFLKTVLSNARPTNLQTANQCGIITSSSVAYPWQASVLIKQDNTEQYTCGAVLISPSHVLTAAHCVTFKNDNIDVPTESIFVVSARGEKLTVTKIKVHPGYDSNSLFNDVAILQLDTGLSVNDNLIPICLSNKAGLSSTPALTGYNIRRAGKLGRELTEVRVEKLETSDCVKRAPELENILRDDTYCVSYVSDGKHCVGDSGSSLVSQNDNISTVKGIVSVGILLQNKSECNPGNIVVVTDITKHIKWILRAIS